MGYCVYIYFIYIYIRYIIYYIAYNTIYNNLYIIYGPFMYIILLGLYI